MPVDDIKTEVKEELEEIKKSPDIATFEEDKATEITDLLTDPSAPTAEQDVTAEDTAIQDLLEDIQGSFERQFDQEFEELSDLPSASTTAAAAAEEGGGTGEEEPLAFVNSMEPPFSINPLETLGQQERFHQVHQESPHVASSSPMTDPSSSGWTSAMPPPPSSSHQRDFLGTGPLPPEGFEESFYHQQQHSDQEMANMSQMDIQQQQQMFSYSPMHQPSQFHPQYFQNYHPHDRPS